MLKGTSISKMQYHDGREYAMRTISLIGVDGASGLINVIRANYNVNFANGYQDTVREMKGKGNENDA